MATSYGIILAGGSGVRMGSKARKQYLSIGNAPILAHTLHAFDSASSIDQIILVAPADDIDFIQSKLLAALELSTQTQVITGGSTRQASVYQGLLAVKDTNALVAIHDGVRPFITPIEIDQCIDTAADCGACILGIPISETMKQVHKDCIRKTVDRNNMWLAQTPQAFAYQTIRKAHDIAMEEGIDGTDDAMLVERLGITVRIIKGNRRNIKITTSDDLSLANAILKSDGNC